jgi:hypothetical protein
MGDLKLFRGNDVGVEVLEGRSVTDLFRYCSKGILKTFWECVF